MVRHDWLRVGLGMFLIAFGANLFAPLLPAYRLVAGLSQPQVTFLLAIYVVGLVPALLVGGPLSDLRGRRALMRPALLASALGSLVLCGGVTGSVPVLAAGRFIAGVAIGLVMAAGAAWLKELSSGPVHLGARRATVALSAGFGLGPLISGFIAEFLPLPDLLPYLVHLALLAAVGPLVWTTRAVAPPPTARTWFSRSVFSGGFVWTVALWAPWVFGAASTSFATLPTLVDDSLDHPIAYTGMIAAVTMGTGTLIQPLATRFGTRTIPPSVLGLVMIVAGMSVGAAVAVTQSVWLVVVAAVLLGAGYGVLMVSGLREVQRMAPPAELGAATAMFYSLTYVGFFAPFILSQLGPIFSYPACFLAGAAVAAVSILPVLVASRRTTHRVRASHSEPTGRPAPGTPDEERSG